VDTEFFWERTFYPVLGLVQLATRDACWLIDAVRLTDLRALGPVLSSDSVTKVLHDAQQDLGILSRATGALPRSVFDTRLAAGFAELGSTVSLQTLLRETLGVELPKTETRSNWLRRPLSAEQLRYAADDVVHLLPLRDALLSRCASETSRDWLRQELALLDDPAGYRDRDPRLMYLRVKGSARLDARQLAVLREIAAWREEEARKRDWPRAHVLSDDLLVAIAQLDPDDGLALGALRDWPRNMPETATAAVLAAAARGRSLPEVDCPQPAGDSHPTARRALKQQSDRLLAHIAATCKAHGIDPAVVASRSEADAYVQRLAQKNTAGLPLSGGWRKTLIANFAL